MATESEKREKERNRLGKELLKEAGRKEPDLRIMRLLLEQGADVNRLSSWDCEPSVLRLARKRDAEGVRLMLEFGADRYLGTALHCAVKNKDTELIKLLAAAGARIDGDELDDVLRGGRDMLRLLLDNGAINLRRTKHGTSINVALNATEKYGDPEMIAMMREAVEKDRARDAAQAAATTAVDPRDRRIAELEQQIRQLAGSLTAVQRELEDIKNPQPLDKKKLAFPDTSSPWPSRNSAP